MVNNLFWEEWMNNIETEANDWKRNSRILTNIWFGELNWDIHTNMSWSSIVYTKWKHYNFLTRDSYHNYHYIAIFYFYIPIDHQNSYHSVFGLGKKNYTETQDHWFRKKSLLVVINYTCEIKVIEGTRI